MVNSVVVGGEGGGEMGGCTGGKGGGGGVERKLVGWERSNSGGKDS